MLRQRIGITSIIALLLMLVPTMSRAQREYFRIMTFNVENLFDTLHDEGKNDYEYLPDSELEWTEQRFIRKLHNLADVISEVGGQQWPALVGLVEVENEHVLQELLQKTVLGRMGYKYYISDSDDRRGIDVALLYLPDLFSVQHCEEWQVHFTRHPEKVSRNVLHLSGNLFNKQKLHVMMVHLPSRREGKTKTDPDRRDVVSLLQSKCDSILTKDPSSGIVVMGDFNATPQDTVTRIWAHPLIGRRTLYKSHLMYDLTSRTAPGAIPGSYFFRGRWDQIDRIVVSGNLLESKRRKGLMEYKWNSARSVMIPRYMRRGTDGRFIPRRTYGGTHYLGGVSDHLPVVADFILFKRKESTMEEEQPINK